MDELYSYNDYRYYLEHSWGTSPAQKLREKEYNKAYYESHKEKWGIKGSSSEKKKEKYYADRSNTHEDLIDAVFSHRFKFMQVVEAKKYFENNSRMASHDAEWEEVVATKENGKTVYKNVATVISENPEAYRKEPLDLSESNLNSIVLDAKKVNPTYNDAVNNKNGRHYYYSGVTNNCMRCVLAFELRKRGYDVAAGRSDTGLAAEDIKICFGKDEKGSKHAKQATGDRIPKFLEKQPPESSGIITINWDNGSGHIINWFKTKEGKLHIIDPQSINYTKKIYNGIDDYIDDNGAMPLYYLEERKRFLRRPIYDEYSQIAYRLDDHEINWGGIANSYPGGIRIADERKAKVRNKETGKIVSTW